jgi:microcystin-dependent protein
LLCAGQQVSTTTYAALYAVISTTYGSGPGTFGIPDLRGRIPAGKDDMGGSAASRITSASSISGATLGASGGDQLQQSHAHSVSISDPGHTHAPQSGTSFWGNSGSSGGGQPTGGGFSTVGGVTASSTTGITATAGNSGSGYSQNMPPVIIANYIIKF